MTKLDELIINIQCAKGVIEKAAAAGFVPEKRIVDYLNCALGCVKGIEEGVNMLQQNVINSNRICSYCSNFFKGSCSMNCYEFDEFVGRKLLIPLDCDDKKECS
jgi:hypothetical protein